MAKIYTRITWVDEVLASAERYTILEDGGGAFKDDMQIALKQTPSQAGTEVNASRLNNIETGIDELDDIILGGIGSLFTSIELGHATDTTLTRVSAGIMAVEGLSIRAGKQSIFVPAGAMRPTVSNGCAAITDVETTAARPDMTVLDFDNGADEHAQFQVALPKSWDEGTVTFQVFWTTTATNTDGVAWALQGVSVADDSTIDVVYGTPIVVTDDNISAAEDMLVTAESGAMTISSAAADTMTYFRVFRDISDGNDDMTEDARLIGIKLFFTTDALTDD